MIGDASDIEAGTVLQADVCIVGAGAAGISLALGLLDSGLSVVVLEGGGDQLEADTQALYAGTVADPRLHAPTETYRRRAYGGSTSLWGGRCVPLDPIDFEARPWIAGSGWPIGHDTLLPWYGQANALCEAGRFAYSEDTAFPGGVRPMLAGFGGEDFTATTLERFSLPTHFGQRYRARLAQSPAIRVLLHANVIGLDVTPDGGAVDGVRAASLDGRRFSVRAAETVLAAGGLEVARLLLAARAHHPDGIGNAHGQVGRHYMCHIAGTLGALRHTGGPHAAWHGYDVAADGVYCRRRLALGAAAQRRLRTGNFIARLHHPRVGDPSHRSGALSLLAFAKPFISYEYGSRLRGAVSLPDALRHVRNLAADPGGAAGFLAHWLARRTLATRKYPSVVVAPRTGIFSLDFHAEQEPNPLSRVSLTHATDALGLPQILVDWRSTPTDLHTVRAAFAALAAQLAACGAGVLDYDPAEVELAALRDGAYGGHHIGTARMSADPRCGVVDADCLVHGMRNLYVAGSAVFPTSGQANPTLTIVALALRLAGRLKEGKAFFFEKKKQKTFVSAVAPLS